MASCLDVVYRHRHLTRAFISYSIRMRALEKKTISNAQTLKILLKRLWMDCGVDGGVVLMVVGMSTLTDRSRMRMRRSRCENLLSWIEMRRRGSAKWKEGCVCVPPLQTTLTFGLAGGFRARDAPLCGCRPRRIDCAVPGIRHQCTLSPKTHPLQLRLFRNFEDLYYTHD